MNKPKVLIFDDEKIWANIMSKTLKQKFSVVSTTRQKNWNQNMRSTFWDIILVDVQIGTAKTGAQLSEEAILNYNITSPIILISGVVDLHDVKKKYGNIFYDYICKEESDEKLLKSTLKAYEGITEGNHLKKMLSTLAKRHHVYDDEIIPEFVKTYNGTNDLLKNIEGKTIGHLIRRLDKIHGKQNLAKPAMAILDMINNQR